MRFWWMGRSQRAVAREFGISPKSVRKMVAFSVPPGYRREQPAARPKLDAFVGVIDAMVEEDKTRPAKQRHTAKRVWGRLKEEHQFTGGYTIVNDYLRLAAERSREMLVPLVHPAGDAQADFGEAVAVIGGVECKAHYLAMDLPHSDDCFVIAVPAETTEAPLLVKDTRVWSIIARKFVSYNPIFLHEVLQNRTGLIGHRLAKQIDK